MKLPDYGRTIRRAMVDAGESPTPEQIVEALQENVTAFAAASADTLVAQLKLYPNASQHVRAEARLAVLSELDTAIRSILAEWFIQRSAETERLSEAAERAFADRLATLSADGGAA